MGQYTERSQVFPRGNGRTYSLTFRASALPAAQARYFWSIAAVESKYFRVMPNAMHRFVINNQSRLRYGVDGSLTLYFGARKPEHAPEGNWLPTPAGHQYRLMMRLYGPKDGEAARAYFPPPVVRLP